LQNLNNLFTSQPHSQNIDTNEPDENNIFSLFTKDFATEEISQFQQYINEKPVPPTVNYSYHFIYLKKFI